MPGSLLASANRPNKRLGQYTEDVFKLPTLLGSRTSGRNSPAFLSNKGFTEDDSRRGLEKKLKGSVPAQKGCVWDATRNEKSLCKGQDLLKHIHHIKVNNEAEKGLSLTEVCRISMRTREFLAESLQWLDSAMAKLQLKATALGRVNALGGVTEQEFVEILCPFTEGVLSLQERRLLFARLDGENKGFVKLELTESEHKKYEELKRQSDRKAVERVTMRSQPPQPADAMCSQHTQMESIEEFNAEEALESQAHEDQMESSTVSDEHNDQVASTVPEEHEDQMVASGPLVAPKQSEVPSSRVDLPANPEAMLTDDAELQELQGRLQELRSMQAERLRRRRKRELEAEIEALQRELEAKTPKASTPGAAESLRSSTSKVSFALPSTLAES